MPTIIRRSGTDGEASLPRVPLPEPGPQPIARASTLSVPYVEGQAVFAVEDAAGGRPLASGTGDAPTYRVDTTTGHPYFDFDQNPASSGKGPTLYRGGVAADVNPKSYIVIGRLRRAPNNGNGFLLRQSFASQGSMYIYPTNDANAPGALGGYGDSGNLARGPVVELHKLCFFAVTFGGATSFLQYNNARQTVNLPPSTGKDFLAGYQTASGMRFEAIEFIQYEVALTAAQLDEKYAHYRAVYQF